MPSKQINVCSSLASSMFCNESLGTFVQALTFVLKCSHWEEIEEFFVYHMGWFGVSYAGRIF